MARKQQAHQYFKRIKEFVEGEKVITFLLVQEVSIRQKSDGADYISLRLKDSTGTIGGKIWEDVDKYRGLAQGTIVKLEADVRSYRGTQDLNVRRIRPVQDRDYKDGFDRRWVETWTDYDIEELWSRLKQIVDLIGSEPVRNLLHSILGAKEELLRFLPAARQTHHPFFGGLLEHTVWVADNCVRLLDNYRELDRDVVIAGAILHDIGKVEEYSSGPVTDYTARGRLIGHIVMGRDILLHHARHIPELPKEKLAHLEHIILAHQGLREWGSPVVPITPEAFFIHMVDNLDAKMRMFLCAMKNAPEDQEFTPYHDALERRIYLGWMQKPELEDGTGQNEEPVQAPDSRTGARKPGT